MTALDAVIADREQETPDLPRLTVANTFTHYARIGKALERAVASFKHIPECTPQACTDELRELVKACDTAIKTAERMLEANR